MTQKYKVFLCGKDNVNWALDTDFAHMQKAIGRFADLVDNAEECDVIQSTIWTDLLKIPESLLAEKLVVTAVPHDIRAMLTIPNYLKVARYVNHWIAPSKRAKDYFDKLGFTSTYIPYGYEEDVFQQITDEVQLTAIRQKYKIPEGKYLIGSFIRDTEGIDLKTPKYVKGPDVFLEILKRVYAEEKSLHVVLAGPRRFWIKRKLEEAGIPYTFVGQDIQGRDDLLENTENLTTINELTNVVDLLLVSSRMEGGPKAVLEGGATKTKVISTDAGIVPDVLLPEQIYSNFIEGADLIIQDIRANSLEKFLQHSFEIVQNHKVAKTSLVFEELYQNLETSKKNNSTNIVFKPITQVEFSLWDKFTSLSRNGVISIYYQLRSGPWGGANQFLAGLGKYISHAGWQVVHGLGQKVTLFNSFHINFEQMQQLNPSGKFFLHRIDGPTFLIRDKDKELDDNIFEVNNAIAGVSIFQSAWSLFSTLELGYKPVNPVLITNAADPDIFYPSDTHVSLTGRKVKLISTSWSDNPKKGGPIYKWLDEHLDWEKYEYTFVGRLSEELKNIKVIEPQGSKELADILRQHDIYITASDNDPCSNALIEAQTCGLPAIYLNRGGHPEIVVNGGSGFENKEQIPDLLDQLVTNYESFRNLVVPTTLAQVGSKYLETINLGIKQHE